MTYLDTKADDDDDIDYDSDVVQMTLQALLALGFCFLAYYSFRVTSVVREFCDWKAVRIIFPAISCFMVLECATLAVDKAITRIPFVWAVLLYVLEALVAPGIFLSSFVVTFLAYRVRSMPFCCVYRRTQQDYHEQIVEPLVQPAVLVTGMNLFSLGLLSLSLFVNFDVMWSEADLAGRTGWFWVLSNPWDPAMAHVVLALTPLAVVSCFCIYFAALLWRYGNELSMTIYSSVLNPWMLPSVGVFALIAGQFPGPRWFSLSSNFGIFVYLLSMLRALIEVRQDIVQESDLGSYLGALYSNGPVQKGPTDKSRKALSNNDNDANKSGIIRTSSASETKDCAVNDSNLLDSRMV